VIRFRVLWIKRVSKDDTNMSTKNRLCEQSSLLCRLFKGKNNKKNLAAIHFLLP
jgi:hypothetical protein